MDYDRDTAIEALSATPAALTALLAPLRPAWTDANYGRRAYDGAEQDTWSPRDIVAHLIHAEQTNWLPRARHILQHGEARPFEPFDRSGNLAAARATPMPELLDQFVELRAASITGLRELDLTPDTLARRGTHPALGTVTLSQLLATWVVHDLNHLHQIALAMAWQYREAVGPWTKFLSILRM
jgi:hypothetical protein